MENELLQLKLLIKKIIIEQIGNRLNESVSDKVYHFTYLDNLLNILENNKIYLTPSFGITSDANINSGKLYSLSLTRSKNVMQNYRGIGKNLKYASEKVRIEFDGRRLNANYKSKPVDYWQTPKTKETTTMSNSYDELEDRIVSDKNEIPQINKYISKIDIFVSIEKESFVQKCHQIQYAAEKLNIPCYFYDNGKDFNWGIIKNSIELPEKNENFKDDDYSGGEEYRKRRNLLETETIAGVLSYKNEENKQKILNYVESIGQDKEEFNNLIEEKKKKLNNEYFRSDIYFNELIINIQYMIKNNRGSNVNIIRFIIKMLGDDMKKNNCKTIKEYLTHKQYIGKKTQKQFQEELYNHLMLSMNKLYGDAIERLNEYSFETIDGEYYNENITKEVPEVKKQLDKIINLIKNYYKEKIFDDNTDIFKYWYVLSRSSTFESLNLNNLNYTFSPDVIEYENTIGIQPETYRTQIKYILSDLEDVMYKKIEQINSEKQRQWNE